MAAWSTQSGLCGPGTHLGHTPGLGLDHDAEQRVAAAAAIVHLGLPHAAVAVAPLQRLHHLADTKTVEAMKLGSRSRLWTIQPGAAAAQCQCRSGVRCTALGVCMASSCPFDSPFFLLLDPAVRYGPRTSLADLTISSRSPCSTTCPGLGSRICEVGSNKTVQVGAGEMLEPHGFARSYFLYHTGHAK